MTHALYALMTPPSVPNLRDLDSWEETESDLQLVLPGDLKQFVDVYGLGSIDNELNVMSHRNRRTRFARLEDATTNGRNLPLPLHPNPAAALFPIMSGKDASYVYGVVKRGRVFDDEIWIGNLKHSVWTQEVGPLLDFLYRYFTGHTPGVYEAGNLPVVAPTFVPF